MNEQNRMHIAKAVQQGQDVLAYDKQGSIIAIVRGQYVEHAPRWLALRHGPPPGVVIIYDEKGLMRQTIAHDAWAMGQRPTSL